MNEPEAQQFHDDLLALGFRTQESRRAELQYAKSANRYLTYFVHWDSQEGTVLFTWELAIGEFFDHRGMQIGSNDALNLFLFPQYDARGPAELAFVAGELDRCEAVLRALNFIDAEA